MLGGRIAQRLLARGLPVRILVRPDSKAEALAAQGRATSPRALKATGGPVTGDLKESDTLEAACQDMAAVITTANSALREGDDTIDSVDRAGNRNLIDAARRAGVRRFIFVSVQGGDRNRPVPLRAAKGETEAYLRESGLDYTIVAPNAFMEVWLYLPVVQPLPDGRFPVLIGSGMRRHAFIAMEDVAEFVAVMPDHPAARNRRLVFGGPEAYSLREVVAQAGRLMGRKLSMQAAVLKQKNRSDDRSERVFWSCPGRTRTSNPLIQSQVLCQLSYRAVAKHAIQCHGGGSGSDTAGCFHTVLDDVVSQQICGRQGRNLARREACAAPSGSNMEATFYRRC